MMGTEHIRNLLALEGAEVVAVADPHPRSLDWAQLAVGLDTPLLRFEHHRDLLASAECDVVVIASPNHTHVDVLLDVLDAGVHVLVEKPLCTTVTDCQRVMDAASRGPGDRVVWVGLEYRFMPQTAALLDQVRAGSIGAVRMVAVREHRLPFLPKVGNWNRFNRNTGGTLVEKCCHFFDLMNLIVGTRPVRVMASGGQDVNHLEEEYDGEVPDILDNAFVVVDYEGGARAMLDLCMFAEASEFEQELSVVGDEGKVETAIPGGDLIVGRRQDGIGRVRREAPRPSTAPGTLPGGAHHGASYLEHVAMAEAIRGGRPAEVTLEDGLWSVAVGQAAHRSIDEGRPVHLQEVLA
jgi:predicted dehydrogenase